MTGQIRLFEKIDGLLVEVPPVEAERRRAGRSVSSMSLVIDVLWTPEEEAARAVEEARAAESRAQRQEDEETVARRRNAARATLEALGINTDDLRDALG